jgi:predicted AlkP superfamily phosphohydrolase/phosphomutase
MARPIKTGRSYRSADRGQNASSGALAGFAVGLAMLFTALGCARDASLPPAPRVVLLGVDALTWSVLDPLIAEGRLPHFARMRREGASGVLLSEEPIFSPVLWTTISTGKHPEKHGIRSFTVALDSARVPVTSNLVRASRIWEILSRAEHTVGVIGWWNTWPSTPVNGFLCSERSWPMVMGPRGWPVTTTLAPDVTRRTYPEALFGQVEHLIVRREDLGPADYGRVDVSGALATVGGEGPAVADMYAKDLTFARMADHLYPSVRPDFFTFYLELTDVMAHYFWEHWRYYRHVRFQEKTEFTRPPGRLAPDFAARIGRNYEGSYVLADEALGNMMSLADDSTLVMVVSDHGYGENPGRRRILVGDDLYGTPAHWHQLEGAVLAWGYGVRAGARIAGMRVVDVTPTLLFAMGEPVGEDMDGTVVTEIFEPGFARRPVRTLPSHETGVPEARPEPIPSPEDAEQLELLRSLGYVR